jgi:hypothetical protein
MLISLIVVEPPVSHNAAVFIARTQLLTRKPERWPWNYPPPPPPPPLLLRDTISVRINRKLCGTFICAYCMQKLTLSIRKWRFAVANEFVWSCRFLVAPRKSNISDQTHLPKCSWWPSKPSFPSPFLYHRFN